MKLLVVLLLLFSSYLGAAECDSQIDDDKKSPEPEDPKEREAIKFCEEASTPTLKLAPIKNSRGKWDCVACVGSIYTDPKSGSRACCDLGETFSTDPVLTKEGDCCEAGKSYTYDPETSTGGCCAPGQIWITDSCKTPKVDPEPVPDPDAPVDPSKGEGCTNTCSKGYVCACDGHLGIKYGQCYTMTDVNGLQLNREIDGTYQSGGDIGNLIFKVCKTTEDCDESQGQPVGESENWFLQDQLGSRTTGGPGWFANISPHMGIRPAKFSNLAANFTGEPFCFFGECSLCLRLTNGGGNFGISAPCPLGAQAAMAHLGQSTNTNNCKAYRFQEIKCMKDVSPTLPK